MTTIKTLTQFDFYQQLEVTTGLSLVYFSAQACSSCKHLTTVLTDLAKQSDLSVFKVDAQQDQALIEEYEVFHLPAMFLFQNGQYHAEIQSKADSVSILQAIHDASQQVAEEAP